MTAQDQALGGLDLGDAREPAKKTRSRKALLLL